MQLHRNHSETPGTTTEGSSLAVIGTNYVGLVTAACLAQLGHTVIGIDVDPFKIARLQRGQLPIHEPGLEAIVREQLAAGRLQFTLDYTSSVQRVEFAFVCVGTPPGPDGTPDMRQVHSVTDSLALSAPSGAHLVVINKSTMPIGTGQWMHMTLNTLGQRTGAKFSVVSNPEFLREGCAVSDFQHPDRIVLGADDSFALERVARLYERLRPTPPIVATTLRSAELIKYASNAFLATKISFINEMATICDKLGADVDDVALGMGLDKRIGPSFLSAGIGYGGSCFPKDVMALERMASDSGAQPRILRAVMDTNQHARQAILAELHARLGSFRGQRVGILGLAFKPDTDDVRESPAIEIARALLVEGAQVSAYDPAAMASAALVLPQLELCLDAYAVAEGADVLLVLTDWPEFEQLDYIQIRDSMRRAFLVDGRNLLNPGELQALGFEYRGGGRSPGGQYAHSGVTLGRRRLSRHRAESMSTTVAAAYPNALGLGQAAAPTQVAVPSVRPPASSARAIFRVQSVPALTRSQARVHAGFGWIWLAANLLFWFWWLQPERVGAGWLYALLSLALAYDATILPTAYLFFVGRMRHPRPVVARPGLRVALITLCVPAQESLDVIAAQLEAMVRVHYPHDSWVLDEGNDPTVRKLSASLGVSYFTRAGIDRYNQAEAPFKARTKAGNVNAWLDAHGSQYDFFVQFDIDHRPRPEYLDRVLGYFDDRQVAWVQAPSTYGNLENWVARGAAEQELILQGPLQRGFYGHSETPFIIGSHCTYRMSAIRQIGGFQPTRAEDHLDTIMLAAGSYRGVYVPEVIAVGLGPDSFETYLRQQFAWAVSMIQVLGTYTPRLVGQLPLGKALQFLFAETWYPLFGLSMLILFLTPVAALLVGQEPAHASLWQFVLASAPLQLTSLLFWWWTRRWHVPFGLGLSWRGVVLHIARWPIVLWALVNVLLRVRHPYMITPKNGRNTLPIFALRNQAIYLIGALTSLSVVWLSLIGGNGDRTRGYLLFAILGATYMVVVVLVNTTTDLVRLHNAGVAWYRTIGLRLVPLLVVGATVLGLGLTVGITAPLIATAATWADRQPPPPSPANSTSSPCPQRRSSRPVRRCCRQLKRRTASHCSCRVNSVLAPSTRLEL